MFRTLNHVAYSVGGCVRDEILGIKSNDTDYVLVCTTEEFESVFPDAEKVGQHFPIYLHPETGDEIALTRSEKSSGDGYNDFVVTGIGVSLKEDLYRRDFVFNMIAKHYVTDEIYDPYGGVDDIKNKEITVINPNVFVDDPVRILRCIRFSLRFNFKVAVGVMKLMKEHAHRLQHVTRERIELELRKAYEQCSTPSNFFRALEHIGGLKYCGFEEFEKATTVLAGKPEHHPEGSVFNHLMISFDKAKEKEYSYSVAIAALLHDLGKINSEEPPRHVGHEMEIGVLDNFFEKHRFDSYTINLASVVFRKHMQTHDITKIKKVVKLFRFITSIRKHMREDFFKACNCDAELTQEQIDIIKKVCHIIDTTKFDIPIEIQKRGKDAIKNFIENIYVQKYKEIEDDLSSL